MHPYVEEFARTIRSVELTAEDAEYVVALARSRVRTACLIDGDGNDVGEMESLLFTPSEPFQDTIVDIKGRTLRVTLRDQVKDRNGQIPLTNDYLFELVDSDGVVTPIPNGVTEVDIRFRPNEIVQTRIVAAIL